MARWIVLPLFVALVVGSAAFQIQLKPWPQITAVLIALAVLFTYALRQPRAFARGFTLLFAIALFGSLLVAGAKLYGSLFPDDGVTIVDGVPRRVMGYGWIWSVLGALVFTPLGVWAYHRFARRERELELGFAVTLFLVWTVLLMVQGM